MFLVIFTALLGHFKVQLVGRTVNSSTYYVAAMAAFAVITACYTNIAMYITFQRDLGILKRIRGTPLPSSFYLGAKVVHGLLVAVLLVAITAAFGRVFYQADIPTGLTLLRFLVVLVVGAASFSALGLADRAVGAQRRRRPGGDQRVDPAAPVPVRDLHPARQERAPLAALGGEDLPGPALRQRHAGGLPRDEVQLDRRADRRGLGCGGIALRAAAIHLGAAHLDRGRLPAVPLDAWDEKSSDEMRLLRVGPSGSERLAAFGEDGILRDLSSLGRDLDPAFITAGGITECREALSARDLPALDLEGLQVGPPIARPPKIVGIGVNYRDHAAETGATVPAEPVIFLKASNTVVGPYDDIFIPRGSKKTDWEVELAVVIGKRARYLESPAESRAVIGGFAISNDVSEREFQLEGGGQWTKGKSCETFNPLGPWLVTPDEVPDPQAIGLRLWVNGIERQHSSTANMIFGVDHLVWYVSQFMVLEPGDVINTGTPAGVSLGSEEIFLREGDVLELEADGLGKQRSQLVQA